MKRLTSDNTFEMNMHQLALNQVYVGKDGWAQYVEGPDRECSVCDLARAVSETLGVELPMLSDEALSDLLLDWLQYGAEEPEGVVAILCRALCAMAEVRAQLFRYEDTGLEPEEIEAAKERVDIKFALWVSKKWGLADGRLNEILKAEKDGRLVVLEPAAKEGEPKPPCFYNDMGQTFCLRFARGECDDEPIDRCKECWYCESTRAEAEAALKKREDADNEADRCRCTERNCRGRVEE